MTDEPALAICRINFGRFYVNGRGDVLGPMQRTFHEDFDVVWAHDHYGNQYDARTGIQFGHVPRSTGNIVREDKQ